jgi:hypothetical protein
MNTDAKLERGADLPTSKKNLCCRPAGREGLNRAKLSVSYVTRIDRPFELILSSLGGRVAPTGFRRPTGGADELNNDRKAQGLHLLFAR